MRADVKTGRSRPRRCAGHHHAVNFGMIGGKYASPLVVPPTVAILGAGRVHEQVRAVDSAPAVRRVLPLTCPSFIAWSPAAGPRAVQRR